MNTFLQAVALLLPMKIERVFWDGDTLMLSSASWISDGKCLACV